MNDHEMRGLWRAHEVLRALEGAYAGNQLLDEVRECKRQAYDLSQHAAEQATRDEWYWRFKIYQAAHRRLEQSRVA